LSQLVDFDYAESATLSYKITVGVWTKKPQCNCHRLQAHKSVGSGWKDTWKGRVGRPLMCGSMWVVIT